MALTFALVFLVGACGLAIDIGRMYITRSEAQSFADSAALYAAAKLDGTSIGVAAAQAAVTNDPKGWGFGLNSFSNVTTSFASTSSGPWTATPPNPPTGYSFVQVVATAQLPMYLIGAVTNIGSSTVTALAVAGRVAVTQLPGGEFPFSPYTRAASPDNPADPYGYQIGNQYTLRWGAPGTRSSCGTDATQPNLSDAGSLRGYCCVAQSGASLRQAIVSGLTDPLTIGQVTPMSGGDNTEMIAIAQRVAEDTDQVSATYAEYRAAGSGNGERVVVVPVNSGDPNYTMIGFAGFFLLPKSSYTQLGGNDSACAEYTGAWVHGAL